MDKVRKLIIIKAHIISFDLVKDKAQISNIKIIINAAIEQTKELRKIFYLMLKHEFMRRIDIDNKDILDIRGTLIDYCESLGEDEIYGAFKNIIDATTGKITVKQDWGVSDLKRAGFNNLGDVHISKKYYDFAEWGWVKEQGTVHFNLVNLDVGELGRKDKKFLMDTKFIEIIKNHKIDY